MASFTGLKSPWFALFDVRHGCKKLKLIPYVHVRAISCGCSINEGYTNVWCQVDACVLCNCRITVTTRSLREADPTQVKPNCGHKLPLFMSHLISLPLSEFLSRPRINLPDVTPRPCTSPPPPPPLPSPPLSISHHNTYTLE